jgi:plastocyanin
VNAIKLAGEGGLHDLVFDDDKVPGFKLEVNGNGDSDELKLDVKPGEYTYYCSIPGHRASMEGTLTVT